MVRAIIYDKFIIIFSIDEANQWIKWMKWPKKFSLHNHYHTQSVIPESIPSQKHILQELSDEQVKALNPSQTAEKKQTWLQTQ